MIIVTHKSKQKTLDEISKKLWDFLGDYFDRRSGIVKSRHARLLKIYKDALKI